MHVLNNLELCILPYYMSLVYACMLNLTITVVIFRGSHMTSTPSAQSRVPVFFFVPAEYLIITLGHEDSNDSNKSFLSLIILNSCTICVKHIAWFAIKFWLTTTNLSMHDIV